VEKIRTVVTQWALANALEHGGRASVNAVLGKLIAGMPELRPRARELFGLVEEVVAEVNELPHEEQLYRLRKVGPVEKPKQEKHRGLPELPDVEKYPSVVTRFAPNPNGPMHIGHVRAALLSHEYARRYHGKFILRFEDTNPENALPEMYALIKQDLRWLGLGWDEEHAQSDRIELYYIYAEKLLRQEKAYVCTCEVEEFRKLRDRGEPCPCRDLSGGEQLERWRRMLAGGFAKGKSVVRIKTDLKHPNPAVRDWPAFRVSVTPHPRVGSRYLVWPLYNFSVSIDDHEMGVTHVIRGKEHVVNEQRQHALFEYLGWRYPTAVHYGRLRIGGMALNKTQTMRGIRSGELTGPDDVRLGTIAALRRRGFLPEAVRQVILDIGPTPVDSSLSWETLCSHNRRFVDGRANRYFFVPSPVKLLVHKAPELKQARIRLHPSDLGRGERILPISREGDALAFHISQADATNLSVGQTFRLKDLMNVTLSSRGAPLEAEFHGLKPADVPKIQWVSAGAVKMEVLMPDNTLELGLAEPAVAGLGVGEIVQLERYGFVRIDATRPKLVAVYGHR